MFKKSYTHHYMSFDGHRTDFQGHCTYKLSGTCDEYGDSKPTNDAPYYNLIAKQQPKPFGNHADFVTYLHGWKFIWQPLPDNPSTQAIIYWDHEIINSLPKISFDEGVTYRHIWRKGFRPADI